MGVKGVKFQLYKMNKYQRLSVQQCLLPTTLHISYFLRGLILLSVFLPQDKNKRSRKKLWEVMHMSMALMVGMVS